MNIFRLAFELFVIYLLYKLVFELIIPVYKASKQVRQKMQDIHEQMQQPTSQTDHFSSLDSNQPETSRKVSQEDYIDYEEVK